MGHTASSWIQEYFQIRSGDTVGLNADSGWAAGENTNATIGTGAPFRIRFKVRDTAGGDFETLTVKCQVSRNSGAWTDLDVRMGTAAPATLAVVSDQYDDGAATSTELLTSTTTYIDGDGNEDNISAAINAFGKETEFEFCLMIMSFHDGPTQNVAGNTLEFRLVESDGTVFAGAYTNPVITVSETAGYIGGCMVESPVRIGPFCDSNGNLYLIIEQAHSAGEEDFLIIKSADGGDTWREMDGSNRPAMGDLESVDAQWVDGGTLWILHQGPSDDDVFLHKFRTSDHATNPDTYELTDESVRDTPNDANEQGVAIAVLSDGRCRAFWNETGSTYEEIWYNTRSAVGSWGTPAELDTTATTDFYFPTVVVGKDDLVHIFYKDETNDVVYHKSLSSADSLSDRELVEADALASSDPKWHGPAPVYWLDGTDEVIMQIVEDDSDEQLYSVAIINDGSPETRKSASDNSCIDDEGESRQPCAAIAIDQSTKTVYLLYGAQTSEDIYRDEAVNDGGWGTDVVEQSLDNIDWVCVQVFTHSAGNGGEKVLGYVYDAGSAGGTGYIWYGEYVLAVPTFPPVPGRVHTDRRRPLIRM